MHVTVIGCGYVGLVTGACLAEMGHRATCLDIDREKIAALNRGKIPFYEPGLQELIARNRKKKRLSFTTDYKRGIDGAAFAFIAIGTPTREDGSVDTSQIERAIAQLAGRLRDYCIIVNKSTLPMGTTRKLKREVRTLLEKRGANIPFDIASNPEFLREGSAISDSMKPDRIIIGSDSKRAIQMLRALYSPLLLKEEQIVEMSAESAELTKYAANAMLAARISLMNEFSQIGEKWEIDIREVRRGVGMDRRIGPRFLHAGVGYGGSCLSKDIRALQNIAAQMDRTTPLLKAIEEVNCAQKKAFLQKIEQYFVELGGLRGKSFAIWGLAYKPNTDDIREAPALACIQFLHSQGAQLRIYDPVAMGRGKEALRGLARVHFSKSEYEAAKGVDAIVLVTEWRQFRSVDLEAVSKKMRGHAFFDGRNQYSAREMEKRGFDYFGMGVPAPSPRFPSIPIPIRPQNNGDPYPSALKRGYVNKKLNMQKSADLIKKWKCVDLS